MSLTHDFNFLILNLDLVADSGHLFIPRITLNISYLNLTLGLPFEVAVSAPQYNYRYYTEPIMWQASLPAQVKVEMDHCVEEWVSELEEEFTRSPAEKYNQAKKLVDTFDGKQTLGEFLTERSSLLRIARVTQDVEIQYQKWDSLHIET